MKKIFLILVLILSLFFLFNYNYNQTKFVVTENRVSLSSISDAHDGLKIMQLSDFLIKDDKDLKRIEDIVKKTNELKPDIIIFNGDLLYKEHKLNEENMETLKELLSNLECTLYKYAVIGDNDIDYLDTYKDILDSSDFILLDNESKYLFYKDINPIKITGLTNLDNLDSSFYLEEDYSTSFNLVISHYPDYIDNLSSYNINLYLTSHSLNGLVRIPFIGGIIKSNGATKYIEGNYNVNDTLMYISGGIGTNNVNFRLFNKPEINLYRIIKD